MVFPDNLALSSEQALLNYIFSTALSLWLMNSTFYDVPQLYTDP